MIHTMMNSHYDGGQQAFQSMPVPFSQVIHQSFNRLPYFFYLNTQSYHWGASRNCGILLPFTTYRQKY